MDEQNVTEETAATVDATSLEERHPELAGISEQDHDQALESYREVLARLTDELDSNRD